MFARTVSLFRQLVGQSGSSQQLMEMGDSDEERRSSPRFPTELETTCRPAGSGPEGEFQAKVRNISMGGISLLSPRAFQEGDLINVQLPSAAAEDRCTVLACVVFVKRKDDDWWVLGCTFSRELSEDDLEAFEPRRSKRACAEKRQEPRLRCDLRASYTKIADNRATPATAQVLNISPTGVGLLVSQPLDNGTLINLELQPSQGTATKSLLACIVHVTQHPGGPWAVGCNFMRNLSDEDLEALV